MLEVDLNYFLAIQIGVKVAELGNWKSARNSLICKTCTNPLVGAIFYIGIQMVLANFGFVFNVLGRILKLKTRINWSTT